MRNHTQPTPTSFTRILLLAAVLCLTGCTTGNPQDFSNIQVQPIQPDTVAYEEAPGPVEAGTTYFSSDDHLFSVDPAGNAWSVQRTLLIHWDLAAHQYTLIPTPADAGTITAIQAADDTVYLGTATGKVLEFRQNQFAVRYDGGANTRINTLLIADGEMTWLGTNRGVIRLQGDQVDTFTHADGLVDDFIHSLYQDGAGVIWAGSIDGISGRENNGWRAYPLQQGDTVRAIADGMNGTLLAADGSTLFRLDAGKWNKVSMPAVGNILSISQDQKGNSILTGSDGSLLICDPEKFNCTVSLLPSAGYGEAGKSGETLIGTVGDGLIQMDAGRFMQFTTARQLPAENILSINPVGEGSVILGTERGLVQLSEFGSSLVELEGANTAVHSVITLNPGAVWFETEQSLGLLDRGKITWFPIGTDRNNWLVSDMVSTPDGALWYLTRNGLVTLSNGERTNFLPPVPVPDINTHFLPIPIAVDGTQSVWIALEEGKLFSFYAGEWNELLLPVQDTVTAIFPLSANDLWVGTTHSGLFHYQNELWSVYDIPGKDPQPSITCLEPGQAALFVGTSSGLFRVQDPTGANPVLVADSRAEGYIQTLTVTDTDIWVGLLNGGMLRLH